MSRARNLADLLDANGDVASGALDNAVTENYGFGGVIDGSTGYASSDYYSSSANLYGVVRHVSGVQNRFTSLQFDYSTADKTDLSTKTDAVFTWSYVFIDPATNDFYVSDNTPNIGSNTITIGGTDVVYLFPILSDDDSFVNFVMNGNKVVITAPLAKLGYSSSGNGSGGYQIYSQQSYNDLSTGYTVDLSSFIPDTALAVDLLWAHCENHRYDAGGLFRDGAYVRAYMSGPSSLARYLFTYRNQPYIDTPDVGGGYHSFNQNHARKTFYVDAFDWTQLEFVHYSTNNGLHGDGNTNFSLSLEGFIDRGVI